MNPRIVLGGPSGNPIMQVLYLIVGGLLLIGAVVMGAVILSFALGFALILGIVIWVRVWWIRRKLARAQQGRTGQKGGDAASEHGQRRGVEIINVEYHVVEESDESRD